MSPSSTWCFPWAEIQQQSVKTYCAKDNYNLVSDNTKIYGAHGWHCGMKPPPSLNYWSLSSLLCKRTRFSISPFTTKLCLWYYSPHIWLLICKSLKSKCQSLNISNTEWTYILYKQTTSFHFLVFCFSIYFVKPFLLQLLKTIGKIY